MKKIFISTALMALYILLTFCCRIDEQANQEKEISCLLESSGFVDRPDHNYLTEYVYDNNRHISELITGDYIVRFLEFDTKMRPLKIEKIDSNVIESIYEITYEKEASKK